MTPDEIIDYIFNPLVIEDYFKTCRQSNGQHSPSSFPFHYREYPAIVWHTTFVSMAFALRLYPQYQKELTRGFYDSMLTQNQKVRVGDFLSSKSELAIIKSEMKGLKLFSPVNKVLELKSISLMLFKTKLESLIRLIDSSVSDEGFRHQKDFFRLGFMFSGAVLYSYWGRVLEPSSDDLSHNELGIFLCQHLTPLLEGTEGKSRSSIPASNESRLTLLRNMLAYRMKNDEDTANFLLIRGMTPDDFPLEGLLNLPEGIFLKLTEQHLMHMDTYSDSDHEIPRSEFQEIHIQMLNNIHHEMFKEMGFEIPLDRNLKTIESYAVHYMEHSPDLIEPPFPTKLIPSTIKMIKQFYDR